MSNESLKLTPAQLKVRLTPEQYRVTQGKGTEPPFSGCYEHFYEDGGYACVCCGAPLFRSDVKYNSGSGWPSFSDALPDSIKCTSDSSHGMVRVEISCNQCGAHLGHVFEDGPPPTGLRYCVNSASLRFDEDDQ